MAERMAGKRVERKERNVDRQDQRADTNPKMALEKESADGVVPKKNDEQNREIEKIAMDVLEDERKSGFPAIVATKWFTDGTSGRIEEKRAVVGFAVIVAGSAKTEGPGENQKGRREGPPMVSRVEER